MLVPTSLLISPSKIQAMPQWIKQSLAVLMAGFDSRKPYQQAEVVISWVNAGRFGRNPDVLKWGSSVSKMYGRLKIKIIAALFARVHGLSSSSRKNVQ